MAEVTAELARADVDALVGQLALLEGRDIPLLETHLDVGHLPQLRTGAWGCCIGTTGTGKSDLFRFATAQTLDDARSRRLGDPRRSQHATYISLKACTVDVAPNEGAISHARRVFAELVRTLVDEIHNSRFEVIQGRAIPLPARARLRLARDRHRARREAAALMAAVRSTVAPDSSYATAGYELSATPTLRQTLDRIDYYELRHGFERLLKTLGISRLFVFVDDWTALRGHSPLLPGALADFIDKAFTAIADRVTFKFAAQHSNAEFAYRTTDQSHVGLLPEALPIQLDLERVMPHDDQLRFYRALLERRIELAEPSATATDLSAEALLNPMALNTLVLASGPSPKLFLDYLRILIQYHFRGDHTCPWTQEAAVRAVRHHITTVLEHAAEDGAVSSTCLTLLEAARTASHPASIAVDARLLRDNNRLLQDFEHLARLGVVRRDVAINDAQPLPNHSSYFRADPLRLAWDASAGASDMVHILSLSNGAVASVAMCGFCFRDPSQCEHQPTG